MILSRIFQNASLLLLLSWLPCGAQAGEELAIHNPPDRIVYQRGISNTAIVPITGICGKATARLEARAVAVHGQGTSTEWTTINAAVADGAFQGTFQLSAGWYGLELRALSENGSVLGTAAVPRVGVGEVFIVAGHSVAQGGDINLEGSADDRVSTVALNTLDADAFRQYEQTADPELLPKPVFCQFGTGIRPAPFGHGTYFWAKFGENLARIRNVPVLIFNAAFGGTSLEHWAKSSEGIQFEHSFVKAKIGMPYINLRNTLKRYIALTGIRAILADQGQNDWPEPDQNVVFLRYKRWVDQARLDLGFKSLAIVVNRQNPFGNKPQIREAQERMIREEPACFPGPDYDLMVKEERSDQIHLTEQGAIKAARLWAESLDDHFFQSAIPFPAALHNGKQTQTSRRESEAKP